jgi:DNA-binding response OmpR family regulator
MKRQKIVIVDDSEMIRDLVKLALEEQGFEVVTIESAFGFNNTLRRENPDLALVDVNMPGLKGDKLAEIAIGMGSPCPIVLFSDRPEAELTKLVRASGVAGFIRKSGDLLQLHRDVVRFLKK